MRKGETRHRNTISLERLQRFLSWAAERHPEFVPKKKHPEAWYTTYIGHQPPELGRAARLFWVGADEAAVESVLRTPDPHRVIGRPQHRDLNEISRAVDIH